MTVLAPFKVKALRIMKQDPRVEEGVICGSNTENGVEQHGD